MSAECGYCLARVRVWAAASITTDTGTGTMTVYLCHPDQGQDCYRLVTIYHKPLADGRVWGLSEWDTTDATWPSSKED